MFGYIVTSFSMSYRKSLIFFSLTQCLFIRELISFHEFVGFQVFLFVAVSIGFVVNKEVRLKHMAYKILCFSFLRKM